MASFATESWALVATGGMLALVVIASLHPRVALGAASRLVFALGAVAFIAIALLAELVIGVELPPVVLALPLVPLAVAVRLALDARSGAHAAPAAPATASSAARTEAAPEPAPFGARGEGAQRLLASSPYATGAELSELAYTHPELRPAIASNPSAPASLLQWLTEQGEPAVLAAISARRPLAS